MSEATVNSYLEDVRNNFENAVRYAPYWAYAAHNLALAKCEMGQFDQAIGIYRAAIQDSPQYSYLPYSLGLIYYRLGDMAQAETWFRTARQKAEQWPAESDGRRPDVAQALNGLGSVLMERGDRAAAKPLFEDALKNDRLNPNVPNNLARALVELKQFDAADGVWRKGIEDFPKFLPARVSFAGFLEQRGDAAAAIAQYREILSLDPAWAAAHERLARLYLSSGETEKSLDELTSALTQTPRSPFLLELRGDVLERQGRAAEARAAWSEASQAAPDRTAAARLKKKLRKPAPGTAPR
jgi:tetratricopeptide (TPR) repeat protein